MTRTVIACIERGAQTPIYWCMSSAKLSAGASGAWARNAPKTPRGGRRPPNLAAILRL